MLAAAKEFNVGKDTLTEFLTNKGFDTRGFGSPSARLTAEMYGALQTEFQQDKVNKKKSDQIALPKGAAVDATKKKEKEEAEQVAKKKEAAKDEQPAVIAEPAKPQPAPTPVVEAKETPVAPTPAVETPKQKVEPAPVPTAKQEEKAPPTPQPAVEKTAPVVATPVAETPKQEEPKAPKAPETPAAETAKQDAPKITGPKVIATIDLDALSPANRNKKPAEQQAPAPKAEEKPVEKKAETPSTPAPAEKAPAPVIATAQTPKAAESSAPTQPAQQQPVAKAEQPEQKATPPAEPKKPAETSVAPVQNKPAEQASAPKAEQKELKEEPGTKAPAKESTKPVESKVVEEPAIAPAASKDEDASGAAVIENIQAAKLTGPKVIGKIELPVHNERRDNKPSFNKNNQNDEKRKRKRIVVEKKQEPIKPKEFSNDRQNQNNRGHQGQGGQHQGQQGQGGGYGQNRHQGGGQQGQGGQHGQNRPHGGGQGGGQRGPGGPNRGPGGQGGYQNRGGQGQGGGRFNNNRPGQGGNRFGNNNNDNKRPEDREIDKNEIQNKIKETMAKLGGNSGRKNTKAKHRREKRQEMEDKLANQGADGNKLQVTEFVSVSELATLMDVSFAEVISKCMGLGIMVSINQRLDAEVIELVAGEFGYEVEFIGVDDVDEMDEEEVVDNPEDLSPRAPIVTIMGHVDHGKTSLLDYIRNANVVAGEAGGITQHIGAYQVTTESGKKITFLDTPGHEAFTAMRARGAKVADIAIIVIAADDAIMPQTREAISHSQAAGLPMVFAINKVDKPGANPEKIKEQLAGMNLLVEDWGGKYQSQEISAKSGMNIDLLLEKILLEAEILELKANPDREASGTIIEATLDKGRGYVTTLLVQNGTLRQGDAIVSGAHFGKVRAMFNERGTRLDEVGPSMPVQILGLNGAPQAGEKVKVFIDESEAKEVANRRAQIIREQGIRTKKHITLDEIGRRLALGNFKQLNLIIKGDVDGSVEALSDSLQKLSTEEIVVSVVHKAVGQITESDVLLATASDALIIGFQVRPSMQASKIAEKENIEIRTYSIIYDAIDELKSAMEGMLEPKIEKKVVCNVQVRETYKFDKVTVAGCFVLDGKLTRNTRVNVVRDGIVVYANAELGSLKRYKDDVKEVVSNMECGLSIRNYSNLLVGDIIEGFEEVEVKRTL